METMTDTIVNSRRVADYTGGIYNEPRYEAQLNVGDLRGYASSMGEAKKDLVSVLVSHKRRVDAAIAELAD